MSTERDVNRIVRSWMEEGVTALPDHVLDAVLDQVPATPQRRPAWPAWRDPFMNKFVAIGLGAAAVVLALFIGAQILGGTTPGGPGPVETPSPSATSVASQPAAGPQDYAAAPQGTGLEPGEYFFDHDFIPRVTVTVPPGWEKGLMDWTIWSNDGDKATLGIMSVSNVYADPCDATRQLREPAVGPTADDLVAALGTVPGWEFSAPTEVSVDGIPGQYVEYVSSVPSVDCPNALLWQLNGGGDYPDLPAPGEEDVFRIWIIDGIGFGERLVITAGSFPAVPDASVAELEEMINSIQIEPSL